MRAELRQRMTRTYGSNALELRFARPLTRGASRAQGDVAREAPASWAQCGFGAPPWMAQSDGASCGLGRDWGAAVPAATAGPAARTSGSTPSA